MGGCVGRFRWWALSAVLVSQAVLAGCGDDAPVAGGTIQHWDGTKWTLSLATGGPNSRYLYGVWGSGPTDVWAVGLGLVLHNDGSTWTPVLRSDDDMAFTSVWGSGPNDVWITGAQALHWNGSTWTTVEAPKGFGKIFRGWSAGPDDTWLIAGDPGARPSLVPTILRWNGVDWTVAWQGIARDHLGCIRGSTSGDVWAGGIRGSEDHALVLRWNGSTWAEKVLHPDGVSQLWGSGPDDVWLADSEDPLHWDGEAWSPIDPPQDETYAVWGSARDDVWFFGDFGGAVHWNGAAWSRRPAPRAHGVGTAAWGSGPNDVWLVGGVVE